MTSVCIDPKTRSQNPRRNRYVCANQQEALTATGNRFEEQLSPGACYWWSVRARFKIDCRACLTSWLPFADKQTDEHVIWLKYRVRLANRPTKSTVQRTGNEQSRLDLIRQLLSQIDRLEQPRG